MIQTLFGQYIHISSAGRLQYSWDDGSSIQIFIRCETTDRINVLCKIWKQSSPNWSVIRYTRDSSTTSKYCGKYIIGLHTRCTLIVKLSLKHSSHAKHHFVQKGIQQDFHDIACKSRFWLNIDKYTPSICSV